MGGIVVRRSGLDPGEPRCRRRCRRSGSTERRLALPSSRASATSVSPPRSSSSRPTTERRAPRFNARIADYVVSSQSLLGGAAGDRSARAGAESGRSATGNQTVPSGGAIGTCRPRWRGRDSALSRSGARPSADARSQAERRGGRASGRGTAPCLRDRLDRSASRRASGPVRRRRDRGGGDPEGPRREDRRASSRSSRPAWRR